MQSTEEGLLQVDELVQTFTHCCSWFIGPFYHLVRVFHPDFIKPLLMAPGRSTSDLSDTSDSFLKTNSQKWWPILYPATRAAPKMFCFHVWGHLISSFIPYFKVNGCVLPPCSQHYSKRWAHLRSSASVARWVKRLKVKLWRNKDEQKMKTKSNKCWLSKYQPQPHLPLFHQTQGRACC